MQLVLPKGKVRLLFVYNTVSVLLLFHTIAVIPKAAKISGMTIFINQQVQEITDNATLSAVVFAQLGEKQAGIAVAVNQKVIPRAQHLDFILKEGDQILIIKATQGG